MVPCLASPPAAHAWPGKPGVTGAFDAERYPAIRLLVLATSPRENSNYSASDTKPLSKAETAMLECFDKIFRPRCGTGASPQASAQSRLDMLSSPIASDRIDWRSSSLVKHDLFRK